MRPTVAAPFRAPVERTAFALLIVIAFVAGGCVTIRATGADSAEDFAKEESYKATYATQMSELEGAVQAFAPNGSNPGVCNIGGTKQGCFDADKRAIQVMQRMLAAFEAQAVPPRYIEGDRLFRGALAENVQGLELRNKGIAEGDDAAFAEHKIVLERAVADFKTAYAAFPADNRPLPPP
jgi:hypothetical protein